MVRSAWFVLWLHAGCSSCGRALPIPEADLAVATPSDAAVADLADLAAPVDLTLADHAIVEPDFAAADLAIRNRAWQPADEPGAGKFEFGYFPAVAINNSGQAVIAWRGDNPSHYIWASRFLIDQWEEAAIVPFSTGFVNGVSVGMDDSGQAAAELSLDPPELAHFDDASGMWQIQTLVSPPDDPGGGFLARLPTSTRILGMWSQNPNLGGDPTLLFVGRYDLFGWTQVEELDTQNDEGRDGAWLHGTANGNAAAIWRAQFGNAHQIWMARYDVPSQSWTQGARIDQAKYTLPREPHIAVDDLGNAMAIWAGDDSSNTSMVVRRFDAAAQVWQPAQSLAPSGNHPHVCINASGEGLAVWTEFVIRADSRLSFSRYHQGSWSPAQVLPVGPGGYTSDLDVAMNNAGQAVLTWSVSVVGSYSRIYVSRFE